MMILVILKTFDFGIDLMSSTVSSSDASIPKIDADINKLKTNRSKVANHSARKTRISTLLNNNVHPIMYHS